LLNAGAPLETRDSLGRTPLMLCHGNARLIKLLLAHGARIDVTANDGDTPFSLACEYGVVESAQMLLGNGTDLNRPNQWGQTPLILAAREGHDDVVSFLIAHHADINFSGLTDPAVFYAAGHDHLSTTKILLDAGARCTLPPPNARNGDIQPIVTLAAIKEDRALLDLLLARGAPVNECSYHGVSPLLEAAAQAPGMMGYLLDHGADPNLADEQGTTPLMIVVEDQDLTTLRVLLAKKPNLNAVDKKGRTALMLAAGIGTKPQVWELIQQKADINVTDLHGETALTYAGDRGFVRIVRWLREAGAVRTQVHIIAKEEADPPLSRAQRWALAVGGLYAQWNGDSPNAVFQRDKVGPQRRGLQRDWDVTDREKLLVQLDRLERGRTLSTFAEEQLADVLDAPSYVEKMWRIMDLLYLDLKWRERTNLAWDECRAANLVRMGMNTGFLGENEGWILLMRNAHQTQKTFTSWSEMCGNFLDGREIGAEEISSGLSACARLLLNRDDRNSPWNQLDWKTDLDSNTL
jgi:ankyrin repeat protein